jgi:two-component system phosphate regulon sensor histidine kinase PhoR
VVSTCVVLLLFVFERFYDRELSSHLKTHAEALRYRVTGQLDAVHAQELDRWAKSVSSGDPIALRITFVAADGTVLGDTMADPPHMENHADRAEIRQAMAEGWGDSTRWSETLSREMKYIAVRVGPPEAPEGVVRVSMPMRSIMARTQAARHLFWFTSLLVLAAAVVLLLGLARIWTKPIALITSTARSLSKGDLSARASVSGKDEVALLARSLNRMRDNLARHLETIDNQRRTLESLLAQLHEGVVVARGDGEIVLLNPTAAAMLGVPAAITDGRPRQDSAQLKASLLSQPDLQRMLFNSTHERWLPGMEGYRAQPGGDDSTIEERRITLDRPGGNITVLARAADIALPGLATEQTSRDPTAPAPSTRGRLLVLTDITELTHTLQVKTDFVANASHELRTPLSAIRAAVETLLTMDLSEDGATAASLLRVIEKHGSRLEALVSDLLQLSRIEAADATFEEDKLELDDVIGELYERFRGRIAAKGLHWHVQRSPGRDTIVANLHLLTLALDNLLDNAVKFTAEGGSIWIRCTSSDKAVTLAVEDDGCGIPESEHARVFERFYQVERARSGAARGTGLGLSIVRHAVIAMDGTVKLSSKPGQGTRISINVPQPEHAQVLFD